MAKQRILLVDDHEVVRLGLKALLDRHPEFEVVAEASNAREAIERVATYTPDVVVMDIRLPGGSGIEACDEISSNYPGTKVIMLTSYAEDEMLFSAIRAGASGYVLKQIGGRQVEPLGTSDEHVHHIAFPFHNSVEHQERHAKHVPQLLAEIGHHHEVREPCFIFQRDEHHPSRGSRPLSADDQSSHSHSLSCSLIVQDSGGKHASTVQLFTQEGNRVGAGGEAGGSIIRQHPLEPRHWRQTHGVAHSAACQGARVAARLSEHFP